MITHRQIGPHQWEFDCIEPTAKEKYDYNYDRIFKVRQHVITTDKFEVLCWEDGELILNKGELTKTEDLLFIIQEYQKAFGSIKVKIDTSEWRGMSGV